MAESRQFSRIENGGKARLRKTGMIPASIPSSKSVASLSAGATAGAWGGARNRADRVSDGITLPQAEGLIAAVRFAASAGMPLNRHLTIHWEKAGVAEADVAGVQGAFIKRAREFCEARGESFAVVWVRETGVKHGSHGHLMVHVSEKLRRDFFAKQCGWAEQVMGNQYRRRVIRSRRIAGSLPSIGASEAGRRCERYDANLAKVLGYLLKGALPEVVQSLSLDLVQPGGRIIGKRVGWSENIGKTARARWNVR